MAQLEESASTASLANAEVDRDSNGSIDINRSMLKKKTVDKCGNVQSMCGSWRVVGEADERKLI